MKLKNISKKGLHILWSPYSLAIKSLIIGALFLIVIQAPVKAQDAQYTKPSWMFGLAGGANFNFYRGATHQISADFAPPATFHNGQGVGLFVAPLLEFHRPDSRWGFMFQAGYDNRKGEFDQVVTPCNCPADLETDLSYITIEPSLRLAPFKSNFYMYAGPRLAFNLGKSFIYQLGINPAYPEQEATPDIEGDFSNMNKSLISLQIGAGYDIPLSTLNKHSQFVLSPFVSFQPYFGQSPRSIETWNNSTLRVGVTLKIGRGSKISRSEMGKATTKKDEVIVSAGLVKAEPIGTFTVNSPINVPVERRVREIFPLRNYVYFDLGSTEIPERYVLLRKDQVKDFKEDQLEVFKPKRLTGRSDRQMIVYYNILNILGDRMEKNPSTTITLVGSSEKGPKDGLVMAESIKDYLVNVFGIDPSRISTKGNDKPENPSLQPGGTKELDLLREGDRRVTIESNSKVLLMEFQSGSDAPLKPVEINTVQVAPLDSYVTFDVDDASSYTSTSLEIRDENGTVQNFGPYTDEVIRIPGKSILGTRSEGDYKVTLIGQTKTGKTVKKESSIHIVLWTPPQDEQGMRFSIIFEFNESKTIAIYEKYLTDIVAPKIPKGGTVIIHGHTDNIGEEAYNKTLSLDRAREVREIIEKALSTEKRRDVKFEVYGFGEAQYLSPFENKFPEERSYNRTVVIDIIPGK
ncbi:MAG: OmpA family protein [Bacteroidales bacterium]|nr:OmpA family protein [Bacteroidales bacterium]MCF8455711.1 OmpA family protein [Bacteroidales bacterium]